MRNKRILPIIAFLLCIVTLLPALPLVASAWTDADMHSGFIGNSISYQGGAGGSYNGGTYPPSYDLEAIIGYRFTCWRSTDYQDNANKKLSPTEYVKVLAGHTENGYKLGHSINILVNSRIRQDYANAANQTIDNQSAPRLYMNAAQKDYLDKITLAQSEMKTNSNTKVTHSTDVSLGMIDYAGDTIGYFTSKSGPTVILKKPIYTKMDEKDIGTTKNPVLNDAFVGLSNRKTLTLYTGYTMHDLETKSKLNNGKNLYTFIYGERYTDMTGTSKSSLDYSENVTTISDIDHKDSLPFNCNPNNILDKSNPNSWLNLNAGLVATLCGLDPTPGKVAYDYATKKADDTKFGLYDYIIVEPIFLLRNEQEVKYIF